MMDDPLYYLTEKERMHFHALEEDIMDLQEMMNARQAEIEQIKQRIAQLRQEKANLIAAANLRRESVWERGGA